MSAPRFSIPAITLLTLLFLFNALQAQEQTNERAEWFVDSRFGMFIHWGIYSGAEGFWKGEKIRHDNDYAEWLFYRNSIDKEAYISLLDRFDWESVDPEEWVLLAKEAGMEYVTITAKHHDGFALWDSEASGYNVSNHTENNRDIVRELAEACRKHDMKLGLYYSHWIDWEHPYGWDHSKEIDSISAEEYDTYWQEKVIPQMRELLTQYGPIDLIWFDMWIHHSEAIVTKDQLMQLKSLIRELQPECLVNSRLGLSIEEDSDVDFRTLGDNQLGEEKLNYPWQSPGTVAHSWGYHRTDTEWKSTTTLLKALSGNVSLNGNYMLNIGPKANGKVPHEISQRLREMGQWLDVNGTSIYGSGAFDLPKDYHDWGRITYKKADRDHHQLFLHLYSQPWNRKLSVSGISTRPEKAYVLRDKQKKPLEVEHNEGLTQIKLPRHISGKYIPVVVLEYDARPDTIEGLVPITMEGGFSLTPDNSIHQAGKADKAESEEYGTVPPHLIVDENFQITWKLYIDKPGSYKIDASYSFQGEKAGGSIEIETADQSLKEALYPTGQTVGEPNQDWHIDNFATRQQGIINFPESGIYEMTINIKGAETTPAKFNWLWMEHLP
ncbi:MAG: alpha-L-fucosidase [Bacteroidota bacterium]